MNSLHSLLVQLENLDSITSTRLELVRIIRSFIKDEAYQLTNSQKVHLANAIGSLGLNVNALAQPTNAWLRLCITDLQKATGHIDYRHLGNHEEIDGLRNEDLLAALDSISLRLQPLGPTIEFGRENAQSL